MATIANCVHDHICLYGNYGCLRFFCFTFWQLLLKWQLNFLVPPKSDFVVVVSQVEETVKRSQRNKKGCFDSVVKVGCFFAVLYGLGQLVDKQHLYTFFPIKNANNKKYFKKLCCLSHKITFLRFSSTNVRYLINIYYLIFV